MASVTLNVSVNIPLTGSMIVKLLALSPYGLVPPVAETAQSNGLPAVNPEVGHVTVTTSGWGAIVTLAEPEAVIPLASVTLNVSVNVPLTGCVTLKVPVPEYGVVPPVAETVQLKGLPAVRPDVGQVTVTTSG